MHRPLSAATVLVSAGLVLAACGTGASTDDSASTSPSGEPGSVVATTTVLGDVVGRVAECAGGTSTTLMPVGADPHDFSPSSEQVARMVNADLVVANGLGLEEGLSDALASAAGDGATVLEVAEEVDPLPFGQDHSDHDHGDSDDQDEADDDHSHDDGDDHGHGGGDTLDPHFWHDVSRMATAAELIGQQLAQSTGDDAYVACGTQVGDELRGTDAEVRNILASVPAERRVLVTDHDAFGYFADSYDFEIAGVVIPGGATLAEPSSRELAALVDVIVEKRVPAIFANIEAPSTLIDAVADESGSQVEVVPLYVGSVGPEGSDAQTYADMMLTNAQRVADALTAG